MFSWLSRLSLASWNDVIGRRTDPAIPVHVVGHRLLGEQRTRFPPGARDEDLLQLRPAGRSGPVRSAQRNFMSERCCVPNWNTTPFWRTALAHAAGLPKRHGHRLLVVDVFAVQDGIRRRECCASARASAISTASMDGSAFNSRKSENTFTSGLPYACAMRLRALARLRLVDVADRGHARRSSPPGNAACRPAPGRRRR